MGSLRKTHYEVLGIERTATADQIKSAFKFAARNGGHPDKGGTTEHFHQLVQARDTLLNPSERRIYDCRERIRAVVHNIFRCVSRSVNPVNEPVGSVPGPIYQDVDVTLEEIYSGQPVVRAVSMDIRCPRCTQMTPPDCNVCGGKGWTTCFQNLRPGQVKAEKTTCITCSGSGHICFTCKGTRRVTTSRMLRLAIRQGMLNGEEIPFTHADSSELQDDWRHLKLRAKEKKHKQFTRRGQDLSQTICIHPWEGFCGITRHVTTLGGQVFHIDPGTKSGSTASFPGGGMPPNDNQEQGTLIVHFISAFTSFEWLCPRWILN